MTEAEANAYVTMALRWGLGSPFDLVVGLPNLIPVVTEFERRGWTITYGSRLGRLTATRPMLISPGELEDGIEMLGGELLRALRTKGLSNVAISQMLGASGGEIVHLRAGRFAQIGFGRLTEWVRRLEEA